LASGLAGTRSVDPGSYDVLLDIASTGTPQEFVINHLVFLVSTNTQDVTMLLQGIFLFSVACCLIVKQELRLLQARGYIKLHRASSWFTGTVPLVLSIGISSPDYCSNTKGTVR
jgi:hypothetical protein